MKYTVTYAIRGYYDVEVDAENASEAEKKANYIVKEMIEKTNLEHILIDPRGEMLDCWME